MKSLLIFDILGAVGMPQASPTRDTHGGSPMTMDDNKGRQSPGMADSQNGQSRNMYSTQEAEEVRFLSENLENCFFTFFHFLGRSTFTTAARPRLSCVNRPHRSNAVLVLVVLPAPRERLSGVLEDRAAHPLAVDPQRER